MELQPDLCQLQVPDELAYSFSVGRNLGGFRAWIVYSNP
jgi:hypothetical protein